MTEVIAVLMLVVSLYILYRCVSYLAIQDYDASALLAAIGIGIMRSGVELTRTSLND